MKPLRGAIPRIVAAAECSAQGFQAGAQLWVFATQQQAADCVAAPGAQGSTESGADAGEAETSRRAIKTGVCRHQTLFRDQARVALMSKRIESSRSNAACAALPGKIFAVAAPRLRSGLVQQPVQIVASTI